jgi:hypothetical protein
MSMRRIMEKIFVGPLKMILKVFFRRKIFGELSVDFGENIDHYILFVDINSQTNILKRNLKFILNLERV